MDDDKVKVWFPDDPIERVEKALTKLAEIVDKNDAKVKTIADAVQATTEMFVEVHKDQLRRIESLEQLAEDLRHRVHVQDQFIVEMRQDLRRLRNQMNPGVEICDFD